MNIGVGQAHAFFLAIAVTCTNSFWLACSVLLFSNESKLFRGIMKHLRKEIKNSDG